MPPVSISSKYRLSAAIGVETRSRVTPAVGSTMAMRRPASQLNSEDLPTFGRPTMATTGTDTTPPRWEGPALPVPAASDELFYQAEQAKGTAPPADCPQEPCNRANAP